VIASGASSLQSRVIINNVEKSCEPSCIQEPADGIEEDVLATLTKASFNMNALRLMEKFPGISDIKLNLYYLY